jgi:hypothetical protein
MAAMAASSSAKSSHLDSLRGSCLNGACRPIGRCPGTGPPRTPAAARSGIASCRRDLADDALRAAALDADDRAQQLHRGGERADLFLDRVGEPVDLLVEESMCARIAPTQSA